MRANPPTAGRELRVLGSLAALRGRNAGGNPKNGDAGRIVARLTVRERGLQAVSYEQIFGTRGRVTLADLRLSRQGETVAHHVEPDRRAFARRAKQVFGGN